MAATSALTTQAEDFPRWYQDVVAKAEMADNGPVRGSMVIRPYGYAIWEAMQAALDQRIKAAGARNAYFPLLIPESYLQREAQHVEGFSPELAVVTHAGGAALAEPLVVRPTSETVIGEFMAKWVQSYRDLPLLLNQWANVVRWEMRPRLFLRTTEFLWQEGHTAHATFADAAAYARRIHADVYNNFLEEVLALPCHLGIKTQRERFAGAVNTMTAEAMMRDGKALQMATSHELGQNFARAFNITFQGDDGTTTLCHTTSWGSSTRLVGGLVMAHGDDHGLVLPPRLAPVQVVVLAVRDEEPVQRACEDVAASLRTAGVRVELDQGRGSFGRRVTEWEIKGVPLRIEVGPRDLANGVVTVARRDVDQKVAVPLSEVGAHVSEQLAAAHDAMWRAARARLDEGTVDVTTLPDAKEAVATGFARLPWRAVGDDGERTLNDAGLSVRCLQRADGSMPDSADEEDLTCVVARAY